MTKNTNIYYLFEATTGGIFMLLTEAIERFGKYQINIERSPRTIEGYRLDLNLLNRYLQKKFNAPIYLEDITKEYVEEYLLYLKEVRNYKAGSRKRMLGSYRSFFKYAYQSEWCDRNITETLEPISVRQKERHYLNEEQIQEFIGAIDHQLIQLVAQTLYFTGMRISECLNLTAEDIDFDAGLIYVRKGKGNKDRTIPINPKLKKLLIHYVEHWQISSKSFFATKHSGSLSATNVAKIFRDTSKKLGLKKNVTAHIIRHSFASKLVQNDVHLVKISKLLGHADLKTTSIYVHSSMDDLEDAINTL